MRCLGVLAWVCVLCLAITTRTAYATEWTMPVHFTATDYISIQVEPNADLSEARVIGFGEPNDTASQDLPPQIAQQVREGGRLPLYVAPRCHSVPPFECPRAESARAHLILDPFRWRLVYHPSLGLPDAPALQAPSHNIEPVPAAPVVNDGETEKRTVVAVDRDLDGDLVDMSWVDLRAGGVLLSGGLALFNEQQIRFLDPDALVQEIPGIRDRAELARQLGRAQPYVADCENSACSDLADNELRLAFDQGSFSARLWLGPDWYQRPEQFSGEYLPPPHPGAGAVLTLDAIASGNDEGQDAMTATAHTVVGMGLSYLDALWVASNTESGRFERLSWNRQSRDWLTAVGLSRIGGDALAASIDTVGLSLLSSDQLRRRNNRVSGSELQVYLPERSLVEVFRDGRLLHSERLPAGNQRIDTARLPAGVYKVTIRVRQGQRILREEEQLFIRSDELPRPGEQRHQLHLGWLTKAADDRSLPRLDDQAFVAYEWGRRVAANASMAMLLRMAEQWEAGARLTLVGARGRAQAGWQWREDGAQGLFAVWRHAFGNWSANADLRVIDGVHDSASQVPGIKTSLLNSDQRNISLGVGRFLGAWSWHLRAQYRDALSEDEGDRWQVVPSVGGYRSLGSKRSLSWQVSGHVGDDDHRITLNIRLGEYGERLQQSYWYSGNTGSDAQAEDHTLGAQLGRRWQREAGVARVGLNTQVSSQSRKSVGLDGRWDGRLARTYMDIDLNRSEDSELLSWQAGFSNTISVSRDGVAVTGGVPETAGLLIDLSDTDVDASLDLMINGRRYEGLRTGRKYNFSLKPYEQYRVQLSNDEKKDWLFFDDNTRMVTLYPGNVVPQRWTIREIVPVFVRLLSESGKALANLSVNSDVASGYTDAHGYLVIEVPLQGGTLKVADQNCSVSLEPLDAGTDLVVLDDRSCVGAQ